MTKEPVHHKHSIKYYVPCYFEKDGGGFVYRMEEATTDLQMALSFTPDYVLILTGEFDAKTQPYDPEVTEYNFKNLEGE